LAPDKPILVTGASGLLGANLAMELLLQGRPVVPVYNEHPIAIPGATASACDLTSVAELEHLLSVVEPSIVIHCAAATNVDWCEAHPQAAMQINSQAAGELAERSRKAGAGFVFISTDAVFDGVSGGYVETDPVGPTNCYARSKVAGEAAVLRAVPEALVLRINIYGWNLQAKTSLAEWVLAKLERGETVPGFSDTAFAPVLANDIAEWIPRLVELGCSGIYHVAAKDHCSKYEFAREVASVFQLDASLVEETLMAQSALTAPRPRETWLRSTKISQVLGKPMPTIKQGLEKFRTLRDNGFCHRLKAAGAPTTRNGAECLS
jgi:dTDP-4-dehydrorhamnose reductase